MGVYNGSMSNKGNSPSVADQERDEIDSIKAMTGAAALCLESAHLWPMPQEVEEFLELLGTQDITELVMEKHAASQAEYKLHTPYDNVVGQARLMTRQLLKPGRIRWQDRAADVAHEHGLLQKYIARAAK